MRSTGYLFILVLVLACSPSFGKLKCTMRKRQVTGRVYEIYIPFSSLGRTLDKNTDSLGFTNISEEALKENTVTIDTRYASTEYKIIRTENEAKTMLGIGGNLALNLQIGVGKIDVNGAGNYMKHAGDRSSYAELLFVSKLVNSYSRLDNVEKLVTDKMCNDFKNQGATHIVTGFEYGAQCIISVRAKVNNNEKKDELEAELSANLQFSKIQVGASGKGEKKTSSINKAKNVTVNTYCNAKLMTVATNMDEAITLAQDATQLLHEAEGRGVPLRMELTPLHYLPQCKEVKRYKSGRFIDMYLESIDAMMNDAKAGLDRLNKCVKVYSLLQAGTEGIKKSVMKMLRDIREADYKMKVAARGVDMVKGREQFREFEKIYSGGDAKELWNYRYWTSAVIRLCQRMRHFSRPPRERLSCSAHGSPAVLACGSINVVTQATGSGGASSYQAEDILQGKCVVNKGKFKIFYLLQRNEQVRTVILTFRGKPGYRDVDVSGLTVYLSSDRSSYGKTEEKKKFKILKTFTRPLTVRGSMSTFGIPVPANLKSENRVLMVEGTRSDKIMQICGTTVVGSVCNWAAA